MALRARQEPLAPKGRRSLRRTDSAPRAKARWAHAAGSLATPPGWSRTAQRTQRPAGRTTQSMREARRPNPGAQPAGQGADFSSANTRTIAQASRGQAHGSHTGHGMLSRHAGEPGNSVLLFDSRDDVGGPMSRQHAGPHELRGHDIPSHPYCSQVGPRMLHALTRTLK